MDFSGSSLRRLVALTAALAFGVAAPALAAPLALEIDHVEASDAESPAGADGVVGAGDTVSIKTHLLSSNFSTISGISGVLTAPGTTVSVLEGSSSFPDVDFGQLTANAEKLSFQIPTTMECGSAIPLSLAVSANGGLDTATLPFTMVTGIPGAPQQHDSGQVPLSIPTDGSPIDSAVTISQAGRISDLQVRIGRIQHSYVGDLRIEIVHPDGTVAVLADRIGGQSEDFNDTVFALEGGDISAAPAPRIGVFRAPQLEKLLGKPIAGTWKLRIRDQQPSNDGTLYAWGVDVADAKCVPQPVASFTATPNPVEPGGTVSYDASASSVPSGTTISKFEWDLDGNGTFETDTGLTKTVTKMYPDQATLPVKMRITDNEGNIALMTKTIIVTKSPVASFTATPVSPVTGETVMLDGSTSADPDGTVVRWQWDLDGNGTFERDTGANPKTTTNFAAPGEKTVRLRVTDDRGATAIAAKVIIAANHAPKAAFNPPSPAIAGNPVTLDGSPSSDPDGTVAQYAWDLDGNGSFETGPTSTPTTTHTFANPGSYNVGLQVKDNLGLTDMIAKVINVTAPPVAAIGATPQPARPGKTVTFSAAGSSDPDGEIVKYEWDIDGSPGYEMGTGVTPSASTTYGQPTEFTARLRVTDNVGATAVATMPVSVQNLLPSVAFSATPNPVMAGSATTLDASGSTDPDGTVARFEWDLDGNGSFEVDTGAASTTTRTYPNPAVLTVRVRVTDNENGQSIASLGLTVNSTSTGTGGGTTGGGTTGDGSGAGGTTDPAGAPGSGTAPVETTVGRFTARINANAIQKIKLVLKKGAPATCVTNREARCTLTAQILPREAQRLKLQKKPRRGKKAKALRLGTFKLVPKLGKPGVFKVKVPKKWQKKIKRARMVRIVVRGTAIDTTGKKIGLSRTLLLRR